HTLPGSTVTVPKRAFLRLNRTLMSIFAQELSVLVFTKKVLVQSTLTGNCRKGAPKRQLDIAKVQAIT
ncbi:Protein insensitive, partial [Clarias magur]